MFDESFSSALAYTSQPYSEAMVIRPAVTYTPCAISLRGGNGDVITFTQFEDGNILTKTRNDTEISDDGSVISPLLSEGDMDAMGSKYESNHDIISTEMLEDIRDGSQSHPNVNQREAHDTIHDHIRQIQLKWKRALKATRNMGKGLHKVCISIVKEISQEIPPLVESGSEVSQFIPEPRNFTEVTKLSDDIKKPWLKSTLKDIENLINNQNFIFEDP